MDQPWSGGALARGWVVGPWPRGPVAVDWARTRGSALHGRMAPAWRNVFPVTVPSGVWGTVRYGTAVRSTVSPHLRFMCACDYF